MPPSLCKKLAADSAVVSGLGSANRNLEKLSTTTIMNLLLFASGGRGPITSMETSSIGLVVIKLPLATGGGLSFVTNF